jgi:hypothetical protein
MTFLMLVPGTLVLGQRLQPRQSAGAVLIGLALALLAGR